MDCVFTVRRNSIEYKNGKKSVVINLEPDGMAQGEILDEAIYKKKIEDTLEQEKIKHGTAIIILSGDVSYEKFFEIRNGKINPLELEKFKSELPIDTEKIVSKILLGKKKYGIVGVNKDLFSILTELLEESKWKIKNVTLELFRNKKGKEWDLRSTE